MKQIYANLKSGFRPLVQVAILGVLFLSLISFTNASSLNAGTVSGILSTEKTNAVSSTISKASEPSATLNPLAKVQTQPDEICSPLSTLVCEDIVVNLPILLDFSGSVSNTLLDTNGIGTGFTAVMEHSEARRTGDLPVSNPDVNGYEPSLINLNNGGLELVSQAGISYLNPPESSNNNNQVNTLGIGFKNINTPLTIETSLLNVNIGAGSAQAGIWFGIDEDNFVKLDVQTNSIELRKELGGVSVNGAATSDQIQVDNVPLAGQNVKLRMVIDPVANTITAYYAINEAAFIQVTKSGFAALSLPQAYLAGRTLNSDLAGVGFAGIFTTHRNGSTFTSRFDSFSAEVEVEELSLAFDTESISFEGNVGEEIASQSVILSATSGNPTFTLSDDPNSSEWLILPIDPQLGSLEFGIKSGLTENEYSTTVFAIDSDGNHTTAALQIILRICSEIK